MTRPQHEAVVTHPGHPVPGVRDSIVSLAPRPNPLFADAVAEGGGVLGELSEQTRAIMWLSTSRAGELDELLSSVTYPNFDKAVDAAIRLQEALEPNWHIIIVETESGEATAL